MYDIGCRNFAVSGLPCIGCIPIQITKSGRIKDRKCVDDENSDAKLYNRKLTRLLLKIQAMLPGSKVVYTDIYHTLINLINQPQKYGEYIMDMFRLYIFTFIKEKLHENLFDV